jgi:uncharacterized damage-inducible protein DinB
MTLDRIRRELRYDDWANREVLRHLVRESSPPAGCVRWLAHVAGAQATWLARLEGRASELAVWPSLTLDELEATFARLREGWSGVLVTLAPDGLARTIEYVNSKGERWRSRVDDVLTHVVLHGVHHRGQIAHELRAAGLTPPGTDFILAARAGRLDGSC